MIKAEATGFGAADFSQLDPDAHRGGGAGPCGQGVEGTCRRTLLFDELSPVMDA